MILIATFSDGALTSTQESAGEFVDDKAAEKAGEQVEKARGKVQGVLK